MTEEGIYIYSIIKENKDRRFGSIGINNREVSLVHYKDISAVVSNTPIIKFDRLDKKELTRHVATHQKVNGEIMKDYDVVPMAFGIIAPSSDALLHILEKAYLQFKTALKNITGKTEFVVQVWWDQKKLLEELINTNQEIQTLKQEVSSRGGILGMPMKLKLGKLIHQGVEGQRQAFINDIQQTLDSISYDSASNKLILSPYQNFGSGGEDEMIANFSFLIEKTKESELDKKMQELGKKYEGKLRFKYIGPMPPYSFVNVNLGLGNFEVVNEARKLLGLAEYASSDDIKNTYYILAHKYHPDKYGGESKTEEKIKKITQAYSVLENYCQSCDEFLGKGKIQKYSFKKEDVEDSIIMK